MEKRRLLNVRKRQKSKKPAFRRADGHKKKKLDCNWRRPRGLQGKLRKGIATKGAIAQVGYGSPRAVRGLHPSGFEEVMVRNPGDLGLVDPSYQVARIARTVGVRKRIMIEEVATERGVRILNPLPEGTSGDVPEEAPEGISDETSGATPEEAAEVA